MLTEICLLRLVNIYKTQSFLDGNVISYNAGGTLF